MNRPENAGEIHDSAGDALAQERQERLGRGDQAEQIRLERFPPDIERLLARLLLVVVQHHARIVSGFMIGLPVAVAVGAPISTGLLGLDGLFGLRGWQVMYIAEAIPTVVIGVITFFVLTDRPEQAKFLTAEERNWLVTTIAAERRATEAVRKFTLWQALYNPKVLLLALNYLGIVTASLGMLIFIPQMIKSLGDYSNMTVGWLTMIPYTCGAIAMVVWGRISDRMNERRWNLFAACVLSTVGLEPYLSAALIAGVLRYGAARRRGACGLLAGLAVSFPD